MEQWSVSDGMQEEGRGRPRPWPTSPLPSRVANTWWQRRRLKWRPAKNKEIASHSANAEVCDALHYRGSLGLISAMFVAIPRK